VRVTKISVGSGNLGNYTTPSCCKYDNESLRSITAYISPLAYRLLYNAAKSGRYVTLTHQHF